MPILIFSERAKNERVHKFCSSTLVFAGTVNFFLLFFQGVPGAYFHRFLKNSEPGNTPKEWFLSWKRVKEWTRCRVTFIKEWVEALVDTRILAPADPKNLLVSEIRPFEDTRRVQITFPLHILGSVKLKISTPYSNGAKLLWERNPFLSLLHRLFIAAATWVRTKIFLIQPNIRVTRSRKLWASWFQALWPRVRTLRGPGTSL